MWLRRAFFRWLVPAAAVLPVWLVVGWGVFQPGGWALLWVLLVAVPSVAIGQLVLTLLVRARGTVRAERAVSWWDVAGFSVWHLLTVAVGLYNEAFFAAAVVLAILAGVGLFWLSLWQLWNEARPSVVIRRHLEGLSTLPPADMPRPPTERDRPVIVVRERPGPD